MQVTWSCPEPHWLSQVLATRVSQTFWVQDSLGFSQSWAVVGPLPNRQKIKLPPRRLLSGRRFLMRVLDSYGDDYRASQFTIVLEVSAMWSRVGWAKQEPRTQPSRAPLPVRQDEGSQGTDAPTPGNAENEPPEKEGLSPPRRTPAPPEPGSPAPGEGPSGRKRRRAPRDGRRVGAALTPELAPVQVGAAWSPGVRRAGLGLLGFPAVLRGGGAGPCKAGRAGRLGQGWCWPGKEKAL